MVFQIGISRLLLNVKTSQIFAEKEQTIATTSPSLTHGLPLRELSPQPGTKRTSYIIVKRGNPSISAQTDDDREPGAHAETVSQHGERNHVEDAEGLDESQSFGAKRTSIGRKIRQINSDTTTFQRRFWWLFRRTDLVDIHVDVIQDDDDEWGHPGGLKESRLGRLDGYL